ncbi:MAG: PH domain-containing protein [Carbonactinosporaceae bacterium]
MSAGISPPPGAAHAFRFLLPAEVCMIAVRRHPAQILEPAASAVGGLVAVFFLDTVLPIDVPLLRDLLWLGWSFLVARLIWKALEWYVDYFIVTDRRIMATTGLITRKVAMMPLVKVTDMSYKRSPVARLLGYGTFIMESAGQEQALREVHHLPRPDMLYLEMCDLLFGKEGDSG